MRPLSNSAGTIVCAVLIVCLTAVSVVAETGTVTVESAPVKKSPRIFSKTIQTLHYADKVDVLDRFEGWTHIRLDGGDSGWVRDAELSKPQLSLQPGARTVDVAASNEELTLAGKGFDSRIEARYRQQNGEADFARIDRMEAYRVDDAEVNRFLQQGGLAQPKGGADAH